MDKPIITVASPWSNANPCNYHHRELTDLLVEAIERRGGKAFVAGTPIISDGMVSTGYMRVSCVRVAPQGRQHWHHWHH